jgi:hypothetical protein
MASKRAEAGKQNEMLNMQSHKAPKEKKTKKPAQAQRPACRHK